MDVGWLRTLPTYSEYQASNKLPFSGYYGSIFCFNARCGELTFSAIIWNLRIREYKNILLAAHIVLHPSVSVQYLILT